jgi:hypothetical protein
MAAFALALLAPGAASAQSSSSSSTSTSTSPTRSTTTGTGTGTNPPTIGNDIQRLYGFRPNVSRRYWISYQDCLNNDAFVFPIGLQDSSRRLEVWVGNDDCATARGNTNERGQCWIVSTYDRPSTPQQDAVVPVRNIIAKRFNTLDAPTGLGPDICEGESDPDGEKLTFYFILEQGGKADASTSWTNGSDGTGFDLVGPAPPREINVGIGENQLTIGVNGVDDEGDRERWEAFCVPEGTEAPPGPDAGSILGAVLGAVGDAGVDAGFDGAGALAGSADGGAPLACYTPLVHSNARPPVGYSCGTANETSRTVRTGHLENRVTYAVGISGQDILGNAGVLSDIQCGTPIPLDDFYEIYARYGRGGGGFCSFEPSAPLTARVGGRAALMGVVLVAASWLRRRTRGAL